VYNYSDKLSNASLLFKAANQPFFKANLQENNFGWNNKKAYLVNRQTQPRIDETCQRKNSNNLT
jgi:hypothetical protein